MPRQVVMEQESAEGDQPPRNSGRDEVGQVVKARGRPAELEIAFILWPNMESSVLTALLGQRRHRPAQRGKEQRRSDAVNRTLRDAFHGCAHDTRLIQVRSVAADYHAHSAPRFRQIVARRACRTWLLWFTKSRAAKAV